MTAPGWLPHRLVVTGGGSGIGRAVCLLGQARGLAVAALDRNEAGLAETRAQTDLSTIICDVTDETSMTKAFDQAAAALGGPPDALVAAAGVYDVRRALDLTTADFRRLYEINAVGTFITAREFARRLTHEGLPGAAVFLASIAHLIGDADEPGVHYSASKGAIVSMTKQLAAEWAPHGLRVNAVSPGVIRTPMLRLTDDPIRTATYLESGVPLRRLGESVEVAHACLYLVGSESTYITGAVLPVDGGASVV